MHALTAWGVMPSVESLCGLQGCDTFTISPAVALKMFMIEDSLSSSVGFEEAARRNGAYDDEREMANARG